MTTGTHQPAAGGLPCPAEERLQAVRDWLASLERRQIRCVTTAKISRDLSPLLRPAPAGGQQALTGGGPAGH
jgi:hypothetical protein